MLDFKGNQQATVGWFTGIFEGEGSFHDSKGVEVRISNSDTDIIETCESFLKHHNIWFVTSDQKRDGKKKEYSIRISNSKYELFQYATLLYDLIYPSLECRIDEYQSILGASTTTRDLTTDINWLTGIYEAEGSFSLNMNNRGVIVCAIKLANTNYRIISKVEHNLAAMTCAWHIRDRAPKKANHAPAKEVEIHGMKRCQRFLEVMNGKWISKRYKTRANIMLKYINTRLSHCFKDPYTKEELSMLQAVIDINSQ